MRATDATKVGATVLAAVALLAFLTFSLRGTMRRVGTYPIQVRFNDAQGIQEGAYVRVRGVDEGNVERVRLDPDGKAVLTLRIRGDYRVKDSDQIQIVGGMFGFQPPWVEITPAGFGAPAVASTPLTGNSGSSMDRMMEQADVLLGNLNGLTRKMSRLTENLADVAGDKALRNNLKQTAANFAKISESGVVLARNMERASGRADRLFDTFEGTAGSLNRTLRTANDVMGGFKGAAGDARGAMREARNLMRDSRQMVRDASGVVASTKTTVESAGGLVTDTRAVLAENREKLGKLLDSLNESTKQLDATLTEARTFLADPDLRGDLKMTTRNMRDATDTLKKIADDVRGLTGDPKVQEDLRVSIGNLREASDAAAAVFRKVGGVLGTGGKTAKTVGQKFAGAEYRAELLRGMSSDRTRVDFDATIPWSLHTFYRGGFYDFGEGNRFNIQLGQEVRRGIWARYGIYGSKLGVGLDIGNPAHPPFSADLWGVDRPQLDVRGSIPIAPFLDLTLGLDSIFRRPDPVIGVRYHK